MAGMINDLIDMLNSQAQTYEELYGLSMEKKDAIVKDNLEDLQKITDLENILVSQHQRIEKKRLSLMEDIAIVLGQKGRELSLLELIELMEGQKEQEELRNVRERMRAALDKLAGANEINAMLIQTSLEYIEYSLNVMQSSVNQELSSYTVQGGVLKENGNLFDIRN